MFLKENLLLSYPFAVNGDHIKDNIDIFDFTLSQDDMNQIAKLNNGERRYNRTEEALANFASWKVTYENK